MGDTWDGGTCRGASRVSEEGEGGVEGVLTLG